MLSTYRHPVDTYLVSPEQLLWVNRYVAAAMDNARAEGKEPKNPKGRSRQLRIHKVCCLAFASMYNLSEQFSRVHSPLSLWPPFVDFGFRGKNIRIVSVAADESYSFGATLTGRVWENDVSRGRCDTFVLASWFPPYVDFVGWVNREDIATMQERNWYTIQEPNVRAISTLVGAEE